MGSGGVKCVVVWLVWSSLPGSFSIRLRPLWASSMYIIVFVGNSTQHQLLHPSPRPDFLFYWLPTSAEFRYQILLSSHGKRECSKFTCSERFSLECYILHMKYIHNPQSTNWTERRCTSAVKNVKLADIPDGPQQVHKEPVGKGLSFRSGLPIVRPVGQIILHKLGPHYIWPAPWPLYNFKIVYMLYLTHPHEILTYSWSLILRDF